MSVDTLQQPGGFTPAILVPTGYGFDAHQLRLAAEEAQRHAMVLQQVFAAGPIKQLLRTFDVSGDPYTKLHGMRTGWLAAAVAIKLGWDQRHTTALTESAVVHDVGKTDPAVQSAIRSPLTFAQDPTLLPRIRAHPAYSGLILSSHGLPDVCRVVVEYHHSVQRHSPYGPDDGGRQLTSDELLASVPEIAGYNVRAKIGALAVCDVYDALSTDPAVSGRQYRAGAPAGHSHAMVAIDQLNTTQAIRRVMDAIVDNG